jgi:hypothetical protein
MSKNWIEPEVRQILSQNGLLSVSQIHHVAKIGGNQQSFLEGKIRRANLHYTIADALTNVESGRNDVIVISPDSHTQGEGLIISQNLVHLVGAYPPTRLNLRSRIGHNANFATLLTVSGTGNSLHNLYFMHGRGDASNLTCLSVTGDRNNFFNCHFGGPMNDAEAGTAGYEVVSIVGSEESYFKGCTFGIDTVSRTVANTILEIGAGTNRAIFEDCLFLSRATETTPYFISVLAGNTAGWTMFKNCLFINYSDAWGSDLAVGALMACADDEHKLIFDSGCSFFGVTDVVAANREGSCLVASVPYTNAATQNLLGTTADHA